MNLFKKKRKQEQEENGEDLTMAAKKLRLSENKSGTRTVTSLIKRVGETVKQKVSVAIKALTSSNAPEVKSKLFTTPAPLRTVRYILTPWAPFTPSHSSLEWRTRGFFELESVIPVTESRNHEFKTGGGNYPITILPQHVRKYGTAFLNSDGGVLMAGVLDNGTVMGIQCSPLMRRRIMQNIDMEFSDFLPKVEESFYKVSFVPVSYPQTCRQRREGWRDFVPDVFVIEIIVKAGKRGEIYECRGHNVYIRREGSTQGPLTPLQIRDLAVQLYRQELEERRLRRQASCKEEEEEEGTCT